MNKRKDVEVILNDWVSKAPTELANHGYDKHSPYIAAQGYRKDEKNYERQYCSSCGRIWDSQGSSHFRYSNRTCPDCGMTLPFTFEHQWKEKAKTYFKELDSGFVVIIYSLSCETPFDYNDVFTWLTMEPKVTVVVESVLVYDNDYGYLAYNRDGKICAKNSNDLTNCVYEVSHTVPVNESTLTRPSQSYLKEAKDAEDKRYNERQSKKKVSKTQQIEEVREKYVPKTFDFHNLFVDKEALLIKETGSMGGLKTYVCGCMKCNNVFTVETTQRSDIECPTCGTGNEFYNYGFDKEVMTFESTTLPENDLLIRKWRVKKNLAHDENGKWIIKEDAHESLRIYCGKKMTYYSVNSSGETSKLRSNAWETRIYNSVIAVQEDEDIRIAITNSCLRYAGVAEAYGLGDSAYRKVCDLNGINYIKAWYENPSIETLVKSNLSKAAQDAIRNPDKLIREAKNPCEALSISKAVLKIANKLDLSLDSIFEAQRLWAVDNSLTAESFKEVVDSRLNITSMVNIQKLYGIPIEDTMKYMQAAYDHQCIEKNDALNIWSDYLRMAKVLNIDLKDKSRRFPLSMKKEHDVAMFAYREVEERIDKEVFAKQAEINEQEVGNYSYKDYFIVIPKTPEDVVNEATQQKNCLRSYVTRIKEGRTVVCFIRKKDEPDNSFVTVEVREKKIIQLKGYCNSNPRDKKLMEFVQHWMAAKHIVLVC